MAENWVFDCDGVLINSNKLKCDAMFEATKEFGEDAARQLLAYHKNHGGIGREIKFRYFFEHILKRSDGFEMEFDALMHRYHDLVTQSLRSVEVAPALDELMAVLANRGIRAFVVSGAEQRELRAILGDLGIDQYFEAVYGSPRDKLHWAKHIQNHYGPIARCVGDSRYDFEVAEKIGAKFVFISDWTEFSGWETYFQSKPEVDSARNLAAFLASESDFADRGRLFTHKDTPS